MCCCCCKQAIQLFSLYPKSSKMFLSEQEMKKVDNFHTEELSMSDTRHIYIYLSHIFLFFFSKDVLNIKDFLLDFTFDNDTKEICDNFLQAPIILSLFSNLIYQFWSFSFLREESKIQQIRIKCQNQYQNKIYSWFDRCKNVLRKSVRNCRIFFFQVKMTVVLNYRNTFFLKSSWN